MIHKNPVLDIVKGIAIILVVYGHVMEHSMAPWSGQSFFENPVFKVIYTFHMPLFVFISGYLMASSLNRHSVQEVFKSRCRSLFVPFIVLGVLGIIMMYLLNTVFGNAGRVDIAGVVVDQLFLKPSVWFLFTLFMLSSSLICSVILEKRFGVVSFAVIYFFLMAIPYNNDCALYYIKWFYLFYLAGYFLNKHNIAFPQKMGDSALLLILSLLLFCWLLPHWKLNDYIYINKMNFATDHYFVGILRIGYRYIMGFLGIIIAFYLGTYLQYTKLAPFLGRIGTYSLDIYIIQMFILEGIYPRLVYKGQIHLDFNSPWVLCIVTPLMTLFFVGTCMIGSKLLIRKNLLLDTLLLGGRK